MFGSNKKVLFYGVLPLSIIFVFLLLFFNQTEEKFDILAINAIINAEVQTLSPPSPVPTPYVGSISLDGGDSNVLFSKTTKVIALITNPANYVFEEAPECVVTVDNEISDMAKIQWNAETKSFIVSSNSRISGKVLLTVSLYGAKTEYILEIIGYLDELSIDDNGSEIVTAGTPKILYLNTIPDDYVPLETPTWTITQNEELSDLIEVEWDKENRNFIINSDGHASGYVRLSITIDGATTVKILQIIGNLEGITLDNGGSDIIISGIPKTINLVTKPEGYELDKPPMWLVTEDGETSDIIRAEWNSETKSFTVISDSQNLGKALMTVTVEDYMADINLDIINDNVN